MTKIVEYLFEGFLIMLFCTAVSVWFVGNENINTLFDLTKQTVEGDTEIINTSHITLKDDYQNYLGMVPYDDAYTIQAMKEFINSYGPILVSQDGKSYYRVYGGVNIYAYKYIKVNGRCYKREGNMFMKI